MVWCSFFWSRNILSVLAWDVVGEYSLENMTVGSNNFWFVSKFIFHWSSSSVCLSSYFQRTSSSVKYLTKSIPPLFPNKRSQTNSSTKTQKKRISNCWNLLIFLIKTGKTKKLSIH